MVPALRHLRPPRPRLVLVETVKGVLMVRLETVEEVVRWAGGVHWHRWDLSRRRTGRTDDCLAQSLGLTRSPVSCTTCWPVRVAIC